MSGNNAGFIIFMKSSMLYLSKLSDDGLSPVQWNNKMKTALIIPSIEQAYSIVRGMHIRGGNCTVMSIDGSGTIRNCKMPMEDFKVFGVKTVFDSGGSISIDIKVRSAERAIMKALYDLQTKGKVKSIELTPKEFIKDTEEKARKAINIADDWDE